MASTDSLVEHGFTGAFEAFRFPGGGVVGAGAGGEPGAKLVGLVAPDQMGNGDVVFAAPPRTVLDANTAYHFVLYTTGRVDLRVAATFSTDEDPGGQNGWSIADTSYEISAQTPQDGNWVEEPVNGVMSMRIKGH